MLFGCGFALTTVEPLFEGFAGLVVCCVATPTGLVYTFLLETFEEGVVTVLEGCVEGLATGCVEGLCVVTVLLGDWLGLDVEYEAVGCLEAEGVLTVAVDGVCLDGDEVLGCPYPTNSETINAKNTIIFFIAFRFLLFDCLLYK